MVFSDNGSTIEAQNSFLCPTCILGATYILGAARCIFSEIRGHSSDEAWLQNIYIFTDYEKLLTIRDTEPEKFLMLLISGCLGNVCELQKLLNI